VQPIQAPWRIAVVDKSATDPKLVVAMIGLPGDVMPLTLTDGRYDWPAVLRFVERRVGEPIELEPMTEPAAWSIRPVARRQP
jgi:hypothetical protein